jgi:sugar phosphate isomerase/epimerase
VTRFAFSTLGLPGLPLQTVLDLAETHGYQGVELRCELDEPVRLDLDRAERAVLARDFARARVIPLAVASRVRITAPGEDAPVLAALRRHIWLAADIGAPFVRVLPGAGDGQGRSPGGRSSVAVAGSASTVADLDAADRRAARRLAAVTSLAQTCGVRLLLETEGSHRSAAAATRLAAGVDSPAVGVLWDMMNTHLAGDSPRTAADLLAPFLGYARVKDVDGPDLAPAPLGEGGLPAGEGVRHMVAGGQQGWLVWGCEPGRQGEQAAPFPLLLAQGRAWLETAMREAVLAQFARAG